MENSIKEYLNKYFKFDEFKVYKIYDEYFVDIIGDLIVNENFKALPENFFKFKSINGSIYIINTNIESLYGFPQCVFNNYIIINNNNLKYIDDVPTTIFGRLNIKDNKNLEDIYNLPNFIGKSLNISNNINLNKCSFVNNSYIGENLIIKNNGKNLNLYGYCNNINGKIYSNIKTKLNIYYNKLFKIGLKF